MSVANDTGVGARQRIRAVVVGRPLRIGGAHYNVGERIMLDATNPQHQQVLNADGWVRIETTPPAVPEPKRDVAIVATPATPPAHKMIEQPQRSNRKEKHAR